ncbi:MAG: cellulose biosynthesis cyclic di-GMP-binding regulatory protein BcsB, partial [Anaerolineae bacterium]
MRKITKAISLFLVVPLLILPFLATHAQAQTPTVTPTPSPTSTPPGENVITLGQIWGKDIQLIGPYDAQTILFGLPADWRLTGGGTLQLDMTVSFNPVILGETYAPVSYGGTLTVLLNGNAIGILPLNQVGKVSERLTIPPQALTPSRSDGRMELKIFLDSGLTCYVNQQMNVFVHSSSRLALEHETVLPDTALIHFPRPIFQQSIEPDSALLVIPDDPTAEELQSALTVASGLGNLTSSKLTLDLVTLGQLTEEQKAAEHLILIGKATSLPILQELSLPAPLQEGKVVPIGSDPQDGVVEMVNSPWNPARVVLVVSGDSEEGVVKAARAVSTGVLRPYRQPNLAVVEAVEERQVIPPLTTEQTFADLGYDRKLLSGRGINATTFKFYFPPGNMLTPDSFLELAYAHSALLDYELSGLIVLLNGEPIGSVRLSDESASQSINRARIDIPPSLILPGGNKIEIRASLEPRDYCADPNLEGLWIAIWPESRLHLTVAPAVGESLPKVSLASYPSPFDADPTLGSTAFVLPRERPEVWRAAAKIAAYVGDHANGAVTALRVFYGDAMPEEVRRDYHLLIIGRPSEMPIVREMNDALPAPFPEGSDIAVERNVQVSFRIPGDASLGYLEVLPSPWNQERVVLAALGSTPEGVNWATGVLLDSTLRARLAGNLAVITEDQVLTTDTRLRLPPQETGAPAPSPLVTSTPPSAAPPPPTRPSWLLPALIVSV